MLSFFEDLYRKYFVRLADKGAYLERIGLGGVDIPITKEGLDRLQFGHLCSVPFENLDIFDYDLFIDFGTDELFDKIVTRRRGGYCFELNALFMALLEAVGFEVHPVGVRILMGLEGRSFVPAISHRASIVTLDGKRYYSDVGFGTTSAPGISICIDEYGEQDIMGELYTVVDRPFNNKVIIRHAAEGSGELFMFVPDPFNTLDFIAFNKAIQAVSFREKRMVNLRKPDGSISIDGDIFRTTKNGERTEIRIAAAEDAAKVLRDNFGIRLSQPLREPAVSLFNP